MLFPDNLCLSYIDQPQSYGILFEIIFFGVYKYPVLTPYNGIYINDIVTLDEQLEHFQHKL